MMEKIWLVVAVGIAVLAGACADRAAPRFPHEFHLAKEACGQPGQPACLSCNTCHTVSERDRAHKLPEGEVCAGCHKKDAHDVIRVLKTKPERVSGAIRFNHDQHLALGSINGQCVKCHAGVVEKGRSTLPSMSQCFSCHEHEKQWKQVECAPCHARSDLERTLPQSFLRHDENFIRRHGTPARQESRLCQSCHSEAQCNSCHDVTQGLSVERRRPEQVERNFVHRGDFMVRHSIEAQSQSSRCVRCHSVESCDSCHVARGVSANRISGRSPHPPGWITSDPNGKSLHGRDARRDIVLCASCHEQGPATNCIRCHKVGGSGGNPHPGGWKSTQSKSSKMCGYCHE
jgi:hypothetical protein